MRVLAANPGHDVHAHRPVATHGRGAGADGRRADHAASAQDRERSEVAALSADRARHRLRADAGSGGLGRWRAAGFGGSMPRGLFGRSLIIIVMPIVAAAGGRHLSAVRPAVGDGDDAHLARRRGADRAVRAELRDAGAGASSSAEAPTLGETSFGLRPRVQAAASEFPKPNRRPTRC